MYQQQFYHHKVNTAKCVVAMMSSGTDIKVEVTVKLNRRFDFFSTELRDRIETASSDTLSNTATGP
jgi:hypothetical protein